MPDETQPAHTTRSRPKTEASYGIPDDESGLLPWEFVAEKFGDDHDFWVVTILPDGRPHARPTWGVWIDDPFHCGGGERTRWVRNLERDSSIAVHSER